MAAKPRDSCAPRVTCPLMNQQNTKPTKAMRGAGCPGQRARPTGSRATVMVAQQGAGCKCAAGRMESVLLLKSTFDLRNPRSRRCIWRLGFSGNVGAEKHGPHSQLLPVAERERRQKLQFLCLQARRRNPLEPRQMERQEGCASSPDERLARGLLAKNSSLSTRS